MSARTQTPGPLLPEWFEADPRRLLHDLGFVGPEVEYLLYDVVDDYPPRVTRELLGLSTREFNALRMRVSRKINGIRYLIACENA